MRHNPHHEVTDEQVVRRLIEQHPWCTLVSHHEGELVASHYPVLVDPNAFKLTVVTHVGKPDEKLHGLGQHELLLIAQGHHGYISPSWYAPGATQAPTWNFSVAHCYGVPQLLDEEDNLDVLSQLVARFERDVQQPMYLDREWGRQLARGTVGLRMEITRFRCKRKLSLDKDPVSRAQVIDALRRPGPYHHPALAEEMQHAQDQAGLSG
jgi:transcriptional regulator